MLQILKQHSDRCQVWPDNFLLWLDSSASQLRSAVQASSVCDLNSSAVQWHAFASEITRMQCLKTAMSDISFLTCQQLELRKEYVKLFTVASKFSQVKPLPALSCPDSQCYLLRGLEVESRVTRNNRAWRE